MIIESLIIEESSHSSHYTLVITNNVYMSLCGLTVYQMCIVFEIQTLNQMNCIHFILTITKE